MAVPYVLESAVVHEAMRDTWLVEVTATGGQEDVPRLVAEVRACADTLHGYAGPRPAPHHSHGSDSVRL
jgi:hypothetical protein